MRQNIHFSTTVLVVISVLIMLLSCATMDSIRNKPLLDGASYSFNADFDNVLKASRESVLELGLNIADEYPVNVTLPGESQDNKIWVILAKKSISFSSSGGFVRVVIEKNSIKETTVRVLQKKRRPTEITSMGDYSNSIFANVESKLK